MREQYNIDLYDYQQEAYEPLCELLEEKGRACILMPTGTGKAVIGFKYALDYSEQRILWLSPNRNIFEHQLKEAAVYSGGCAFEHITFMTYAKASFDAKKGNLDFKWDVVILDEFHHVGAKVWGIPHQFILERNPDVKLIGMSATAIRFSDGARNMAYELFEGCIARELTLVECWDRGILPMPEYVLCAFEKEGAVADLHEMISELPEGSGRKNLLREWQRVRDTADQAPNIPEVFAKHVGKKDAKVLVLCQGVGHLNDCAKAVKGWFKDVNKDVHVYKVHSSNPNSDSEFKAWADDSSSAVKICCSIGQLLEGVHVSDIDCLVWARRTASPTVFYQGIGRVMSSGDVQARVIIDLVDNYGLLREFNIGDQIRQSIHEYKQKKGSDRELHGPSKIDDFRLYDYAADVRDLEAKVRLAQCKRLSVSESIDFLEKMKGFVGGER